MNFYRYFYITQKDETCIGIVKTESKKKAKIIVAKHLRCNEAEIEVENVEFMKDGFCEFYYGE